MTDERVGGRCPAAWSGGALEGSVSLHHFSLPLYALEDAGEANVSLAALGGMPRQNVADPVIAALGHSLLPALSQPKRTTRLFVDHVLFALRSHMAGRFESLPAQTLRSGRLAPWQERRAKALIDAHF